MERWECSSTSVSGSPAIWTTRATWPLSLRPISHRLAMSLADTGDGTPIGRVTALKDGRDRAVRVQQIGGRGPICQDGQEGMSPRVVGDADPLAIDRDALKRAATRHLHPRYDHRAEAGRGVPVEGIGARGIIDLHVREQALVLVVHQRAVGAADLAAARCVRAEHGHRADRAFVPHPTAGPLSPACRPAKPISPASLM